MIVVLVSAVTLALALLGARTAAAERAGIRLGRTEATARRHAPLAAAMLSVIIVWIAWYSPIPKVHDENSYLLQADLFARGRWTAPPPPMPEFFEQPHVQVVPVVASKYPPGHALLLVPGALIGFPALMPLVLTAVTAALLVTLAARVTNVWIAVLTWVVWIASPIILRFQPGYFSEVTTTPLVLAAWWALLRWRETRRLAWILALALAIGWGAITRPLTMLAFAIPIGVVVVRDIARRAAWRQFAAAVAVGVAVLAILPLWCAKTTGDWRVSPIEKYRLDYLPFDKVGFTPDTSPPRRAINPVLKSTYDYFLDARKQQGVSAIPRIIMDRTVQIAIAFFQGARLPLLLFAIAGLFFLTGPLRFGVISTAVLFVAHLPYAHWAPWTIYYMEAMPVLACVTALGVFEVLRRLTADDARSRTGMALVTALMLIVAIPTIGHWRRDHETRSALDRTFAAQLHRLPPHSIVFIRYSPRLAQHMSVVFNYPDLANAPYWVVHDLGARNDELRKLAPGRSSFDFEEDQLVSRRR